MFASWNVQVYIDSEALGHPIYLISHMFDVFTVYIYVYEKSFFNVLIFVKEKRLGC